MDERDALSLLEGLLDPVGDDAAVVDGQVLTTDMLHETTDFPDGTTRYTAGWRSVGASLSDLAAMGARATAAVAAYGAPAFDRTELRDFARGATDVCERVDARYVGGDLDGHEEFTVATTALGRTDAPVFRSGARDGDVVCVTGALGRSAAALALFERGAVERANELFRFDPRVEAGLALAPHATAMMDSSDGLVRSLHQLAEASDCGFAVESGRVPIADAFSELAAEDAGGPSADDQGTFTGESVGDPLETAVSFGEDFELVATVPEDEVEAVRRDSPVPIAVVGTVESADAGITMDGETLPDRGYTHG